jgi:hypothetical protein
VTTNSYLRQYREMAAHQQEHGALHELDYGQPWWVCHTCLREHPDAFRDRGRFELRKDYSWAIPNDAALDTIAKWSPNGVVEIGAGGGYWAMLLRQRGVDVVAYDPLHEPGQWFSRRWTEVLAGDHTAVANHPDRSLLLCWPMYGAEWSGEAVDLYDGDTVLYVGEGASGCTGDDRMHALLGEPACWHDEDEVCEHDWPTAKFREVDSVDIPQWSGIHDRLYVYERVRP